MNLNLWQKKHHLSNVKLAALLTIHPSYLTHIYAGRRTVSPKLALTIEELTSGQVTRLEMLYPSKINAINKLSILGRIKNYFKRK